MSTSDEMVKRFRDGIKLQIGVLLILYYIKQFSNPTPLTIDEKIQKEFPLIYCYKRGDFINLLYKMIKSFNLITVRKENKSWLHSILSFSNNNIDYNNTILELTPLGEGTINQLQIKFIAPFATLAHNTEYNTIF